MANTGFTLPGTGANNADAGTTAWTNPGNVTADDAANATSGGFGSGTTQYLHATNFGFAIPSAATINGVVARVQRLRTSVSVVDQTIQLIVGGTRTGDNKADTGTNWPTSATNKDYGTSSDLWGLTPTVAQVNASDFGLAVRATYNTDTATVDVVWLDVYYTLPVGASAGTATAASVSQATKKSTFTEAATALAAAVGAPTFKATGAVTASAAVAGRQGYLGVAAGTSSIASLGQATKKSTGSVTTASALDAVSQATKKSPGAISGSVAVAAVSNATKKAVGLVSASDTVAAVAGSSGATKKAVAVVSENGSTVLALSSYKRGIRRPSALNDVAALSTVTLHDLPAPVPLSIQ